jgi:hypothetical protein
MTKTLLVEATSTPVAAGKGRWKAVLITPGQGSSGFYSEEMLKEYGPLALRKGAKSFVTHNRLENGEPDPFSMWGFLAEDATYEEGVGLVSEIEVLSSWQDRISEVAPHTALSIYVMGEADSDGRVTKLIPDPSNGADLVVHPGRPGSGLVEKLREAMASANGSAPADADIKEREKNMEENIKALLESFAKTATERFVAIEAKLDSLVTLSESAAAAERETADAFKVADEVSEAVIEAKLPKQGRSRVLEAVKAGISIADAVKSETEYVKAITESLGKPEAAGPVTGRVVEADAQRFSLTKIAEAK